MILTEERGGFDLETARADLITANKPTYDYLEATARVVKTHMPGAIAEIERLLADLEQSERCIEARLDVIDQQAAQIKELEAQVINWTETAREYATNSDYWQDRARKAEGKISIGDHIVGPDQMVPNGDVWQITEERKAALWHAIKVLKENDIMEEPEEHLWDEEVTVLQAMLTEAGQE